MASGRITWKTSSKLGQRLSAAMTQLIEGRKALGELSRVVSRYNDDNDSLAADFGMDPKEVQAFRDILARANAELCDETIVKIDPSGQTNTRTLLDSMA